MEPTLDNQDGYKISKYKVKRFFDRLERSPLSKLMSFQTPQEKMQAIIKFAEIVGINEEKLSILFSKIRKNTK